MTRLAKHAQIHLQEHLLSKVSARPPLVHQMVLNIRENAVQHKEKLKLITGLCPAKKVGVMNGNGEFVEVLAMLDSGSNTSLLSKNAAR